MTTHSYRFVFQAQAFPILYEPKQMTNLIEFRNTIHLLPTNLTFTLIHKPTQSEHRKFCKAFLNDATVKWETYDVFVVLMLMLLLWIHTYT